MRRGLPRALLTAGLALGLGASLAGAAHAQAGPVDAVAVHPSPNPGDLLHAATTETGRESSVTVGLGILYADKPLSFQGTDEFGRVFLEDTVKSRAVAELLLSWTPLKWLQVGAALPATVMGTSEYDPQETVHFLGDKSGAGAGEPRLHVKAIALRSEAIAIGLETSATLPGGDETLLAANGLGFGEALLVDVLLGPLTLTANAGAYVRPTPVTLGYPSFGRPGVEIGNEIRAGLGAEYEVSEAIAAVGEVYLRTPLDAPMDDAGGTLLEPLAGLRWKPAPGMVLTAGGGGGTPLYTGWGTARFRAMVDFRMTFTFSTDADEDGIPDGDDGCQVLPEDRDGFEDEDGCPDPDNDGDGFLDFEDGCPGEAEDRDGNADEDGCPEEDNDQDGLSDVEDQCPLDPEDFDGHDDEDGCPELDNDGDGVADANDRCPDVPETVNDFEDQDGCPDFPGVELVQDRIRLKERIEFDPKTHEPAVSADAVLRTLARFLAAHPELPRIRIDVHTDGSWKKGLDVEVARSRGEALVRYLVIEGVSPKRLEVRAAGASEPIASDATPDGRAANNRVELVVPR